MSRFMYTEDPMWVLVRIRGKLSAKLRKFAGKKRRVTDCHWLSVWIREYDKAIDTLLMAEQRKERSENGGSLEFHDTLPTRVATAPCLRPRLLVST